MIATERRGRLRRISDLNILTIEAEPRRREPDVAECYDRIATSLYVVRIGVVSFLFSVILAGLAAMGYYVAFSHFASPIEESPGSMKAQVLRDLAAQQENLWILYRRQSLLPGRSAIPSEGTSLTPAAWRRRAREAHGLFLVYKEQAYQQEQVNQGFPSWRVRSR